jgi:hypothetical protein
VSSKKPTSVEPGTLDVHAKHEDRLRVLRLYSGKPETPPPWLEAERQRLQTGGAQVYDLGVWRLRSAASKNPRP